VPRHSNILVLEFKNYLANQSKFESQTKKGEVVFSKVLKNNMASKVVHTY
jgi:hypothetical protein